MKKLQFYFCPLECECVKQRERERERERESLFKTCSLTEARNIKAKTDYKVTVAARHQSRCGKHLNAGIPRVRACNQRKTREKRNWHARAPVITSSFCGC